MCEQIRRLGFYEGPFLAGQRGFGVTVHDVHNSIIDYMRLYNWAATGAAPPT